EAADDAGADAGAGADCACGAVRLCLAAESDGKSRPLSAPRAVLFDSRAMGPSLGTGECGGGTQTEGGRRSRNRATPITPTFAGRPVRAAYESGRSVNVNAAISESLLRQPVI